MLEHRCKLCSKGAELPNSHNVSKLLIAYECEQNLSAFSRPGMQIELTIQKQTAVLMTGNSGTILGNCDKPFRNGDSGTAKSQRPIKQRIVWGSSETANIRKP